MKLLMLLGAPGLTRSKKLGAKGIATNGTRSYVRGSWHRYERSKDATRGAFASQGDHAHYTVPSCDAGAQRILRVWTVEMVEMMDVCGETVFFLVFFVPCTAPLVSTSQDFFAVVLDCI